MTALECPHVTKYQWRGSPPQGEHALTGAKAERATAEVKPTNMRCRGGRSAAPAGHSDGTLLLPHSSSSSPNMPRGLRRCPRRCATAPPARPCKRLSISIWTNWPASSRHAALGETDNAVPHRDRGSPTGAHRNPPRRRSLRNGGARSRRGSPLWTPWTTRSAGAAGDAVPIDYCRRF